MDNIGCFGRYKKDRTCELCAVININIVGECEKLHEKEENMRMHLHNISMKCIYKVSRCEDRTCYFACSKNGKIYSDEEEMCRPTLECEKYMKEDNND